MRWGGVHLATAMFSRELTHGALLPTSGRLATVQQRCAFEFVPMCAYARATALFGIGSWRACLLYGPVECLFKQSDACLLRQLTRHGQEPLMVAPCVLAGTSFSAIQSECMLRLVFACWSAASQLADPLLNVRVCSAGVPAAGASLQPLCTAISCQVGLHWVRSIKS